MSTAQGLQGKGILVTGAASGIGLATVERLLAKDAIVVGIDLAADAPAGDPVSAVLPMAHVELWLDSEGAEGEARAAQVRRDDLTAVRAASDRWLSTPSAHPLDPAAHQVFGWFFVLTGDLPRANVHLSRTGGRIADFPWGYYDDPVRMYRACLSDAKVPPPG